MVFTVVFLKFAIMLKKYFSILFVFLVLSLAVLSPGCKRKTEDVESEVIEEVKDTLPPLGFWPDSLDLSEDAVRNGETF